MCLWELRLFANVNCEVQYWKLNFNVKDHGKFTILTFAWLFSIKVSVSQFCKSRLHFFYLFFFFAYSDHFFFSEQTEVPLFSFSLLSFSANFLSLLRWPHVIGMFLPYFAHEREDKDQINLTCSWPWSFRHSPAWSPW